MLPGVCSRGQMVLKKKLFEEFQERCFIMTILDIWMEWFEQFRVFVSPKFLLKLIYGLE